MSQQAILPTQNVASRTKLTVKHMQDMKGKEPISMFACNDPWIVAAAEMAGIHICRTTAWGENEEERRNCLVSTVRQLRKAAPNIILNPFMRPSMVHESEASACYWGSVLLSEGADILLCLGITPKRLSVMAENRLPVFAHVGLTPIFYTQWTGGYVRVGKTAEDALKIFQQAYDYQEAGAAMITVEMTAKEVTNELAKRLRIPVISIAGGAGGDGAEIVVYDLLGLNPAPIPKHAKQYRQFFNEALAAFKEFANDIKTKAYPDKEQHGWSMDPVEYEGFLNGVERIIKK